MLVRAKTHGNLDVEILFQTVRVVMLMVEIDGD